MALRGFGWGVGLVAAGMWAGAAGADGAAAVQVHLAFKPGVAAELAKRGERAVIAGWFYGEPAPGAKVPVDEMGLVQLGTEELTVWPVDQTVTLGASLAGAPRDAVTQVSVNVNVYSARLSSEDNILDCGIIDDALQALQGEQTITCGLLP